MPPISFWGDPNWLIANVLDWFLRDLPAKVVHWPMLKYPCWKERFELMSHSEDLNEWLSLVSCLEDLNMPSISSRYSVYTLGSGFIFCPYLGKGSVLPYSFEIGWRNHHRHRYSFAHLGSFECTRILILGGFKFPGVVKHVATSGPRQHQHAPKNGWDAYVAHCESLCRSAGQRRILTMQEVSVY